MSVATGLRHLFTQTVTLAPFLGLDAYGEPTWGEPVEYAARVQQRPKRIVTAQGDELVAMTQVYIAGAPPAFSIQDQLTLPSPYVPSQPPILALQLSPDAQGTLLAVLYA